MPSQHHRHPMHHTNHRRTFTPDSLMHAVGAYHPSPTLGPGCGLMDMFGSSVCKSPRGVGVRSLLSSATSSVNALGSNLHEFLHSDKAFGSLNAKLRAKIKAHAFNIGRMQIYLAHLSELLSEEDFNALTADLPVTLPVLVKGRTIHGGVSGLSRQGHVPLLTESVSESRSSSSSSSSSSSPNTSRTGPAFHVRWARSPLVAVADELTASIMELVADEKSPNNNKTNTDAHVADKSQVNRPNETFCAVPMDSCTAPASVPAMMLVVGLSVWKELQQIYPNLASNSESDRTHNGKGPTPLLRKHKRARQGSKEDDIATNVNDECVSPSSSSTSSSSSPSSSSSSDSDLSGSDSDDVVEGGEGSVASVAASRRAERRQQRRMRRARRRERKATRKEKRMKRREERRMRRERKKRRKDETNVSGEANTKDAATTAMPSEVPLDDVSHRTHQPTCPLFRPHTPVNHSRQTTIDDALEHDPTIPSAQPEASAVRHQSTSPSPSPSPSHTPSSPTSNASSSSPASSQPSSSLPPVCKCSVSVSSNGSTTSAPTIEGEPLERETVMLVNHAWERLFGYSQAEVRQLLMARSYRALYDFIRQDTLPIVHRVTLEAMTNGLREYSFLYVIANKYGAEIPCISHVKIDKSDCNWEAGEMGGFSQTWIPITNPRDIAAAEAAAANACK